MLYPLIETAEALLKTYRTVPVFSARLMDCRTPVGIFAALKENFENCFLLESVEQSERWGRYSFICVEPKGKITLQNGKAVISAKDGCHSETVSDPAKFLNRCLSEYSSPHLKGYPRFTGGLVGYFGYNMLRCFEKALGKPPADDLKMPDSILYLCDEVIAFDHLNGKTYVIMHVSSGSNLKQQYEKCESHAEKLFCMMDRTPEESGRKQHSAPTVSSNVTREEFVREIKKVKSYIKAGDIFQAVPSQRFEVENPPDAFSVYRVLRATNPSPYLYYFQAPDYQITGASPEMLMRIDGRTVVNCPIAGTSPRGRNDQEDKEFEQRLLNDEKERAEHTMLVDLGRNDVGRVCKFGTVKVDNMMHVERASRVMHLVSEVSGTLKDGKTAADALFSLLPAGTLSGAPKIRAMQIIDELEPVKRSVYGGAVGYLGFDGNADTCIAIRQALFRNGKAYVQAGMGVVTDSNPEKECQESADKAGAVISAIRKAAEL